MNKKLRFFLIIIVLVILLGFSYYIFYKTEIDTNNWTGYINNNFKYSLKIPTGYQNKAVYEDILIPLDSEATELNLVKDNKSIRIGMEDSILFKEKDLNLALMKNVEEQGHKVLEINGIVFIEDPNFPENGKTFSTVVKDKVLTITFRNTEEEITYTFLDNFELVD